MIHLSLKVLYKQSAELSKLLSSPNHMINCYDLKDYLLQLMYFLKLMNYGVDVKIGFNQPTQDTCIQCTRVFRRTDTPNHICLTCQKHFLCGNDCANIFINKITENNYSNWKNTRCPNCFIPLSRAFYEGILGPEFEERNKNPIRNAQDQGNVENVENDFHCVNCRNIFNFSVCIVLLCGCRFCKDCLKRSLEDIIDQAEVIQELKCPNCDNNPINERIIWHVVEPHIFKNFESKLGLDFPNPEIRKIAFHCSKANCGFDGQVDDIIEEYECPRCDQKSCPKCADAPHIGNSCIAYTNWRGNEGINPFYRNSQWVSCPWCMQYIQRTTRCKFMICNSLICRGQKYFCFECKRKLNQDCEVHNCAP